MIDISEQLKQLNTTDIKEIIKIAEYEKDLWEKKIHILKVINVAKEIQAIKDAESFSINNVTHMKLWSNSYTNLGNHVDLMLYEQERQLLIKDGASQLFSQVKTALNKITGYKSDNIIGRFNVMIDINADIKEQLFDILLSEELKSSLKYNELSIELKETGQSPKRPKL